MFFYRIFTAIFFVLLSFNVFGLETLCSDGLDNDTDGLIDCADSDCTPNALCAGVIGCQRSSFLVETTGELSVVNPTTGAISLVESSLGSSINGLGFNIKDGNLWGFDQGTNQIYRIDGQNVFTIFTVPAGNGYNPATNYDAGAIDDNGVLFLALSPATTVVRVDVNPSSPTYLQTLPSITLSAAINYDDFAFSPIDGMIYAAKSAAATPSALYRIDPTSGVVTNLGVISGLSVSASITYGAAFFDKLGNFYVGKNQDGKFFRITNIHGASPSPVATQVADGAAFGAGDGAGCQYADPFTSVTIDQSLTQVDSTTVVPVQFTAVFEYPIDPTTFTCADIDLSTGSAGGESCVSIVPVGVDNKTFTITVNASGTGTIIASIPDGVVTDAEGYLNEASTSTDNQVTYISPNDSLAEVSCGTPNSNGMIEDLIQANVHTIIHKTPRGFAINGNHTAPNGVSDRPSITEINPSEGYTNTALSSTWNGDALFATTGGHINGATGIDSAQYFIIPASDPTKIVVWGGTTVLSSTVVSSTAFTNPSNVISLPTGINATTDIAQFTATSGLLAIVTTSGDLWLTGKWASDLNLTYSTTSWNHVKISSGGPFLTNIKKISLGFTGISSSGGHNPFVFAWTNDDKLYTWGKLVTLGDGSTAGPRSYPTQMTPPASLTGIIQIQAASGGSYLLLDADGTIHSVGTNSSGAAILGNGTTVASTTWTKVQDSVTLSPLTNVKFISASSHGYYESASSQISGSALLDDGSVRVWGGNDFNMISGAGNPVTRARPILPTLLNTNIVYIENGDHITPFLNSVNQGEICNVGHNYGGAFGDGTAADRTQYQCRPILYSAAVPPLLCALQPPIAEDDTVMTTFNTPVNIPWDDNDTIVDNAVLTPNALDPLDMNPSNGTVVNLGGGVFEYTPNTGFTGVDTFTYQLCDDDTPTPTCDIATVTVQVGNNVVPPEVTINQSSTQADPTTSSIIEFTAIFSEAIDSMTFTCADVALTNATCNSVTLVSGNTYTVNVTAIAEGNVTATIPAGGVNDISGTPNNASTSTDNVVTYVINPNASDDGIIPVTEDTTTATMIHWDTNDSLVDSATLTSFDATSVNGGTITNLGGGIFGYIPAPGFAGTDTFTYKICDDDTPVATCDTATVTINVTDQGNPDAVNDGIISVTEDSTTPTSIDWDVNDSLLDNAVLNTFDPTSVNGGTVTNLGGGNFGYVPAAGFVGTDTFTYKICDDDTPVATCDTATVTLNVIDQGNPNAVNDGVVTVTEDSTTPTSIDWDNNDLLIDNSVLSSVDLSSINGGMISDNGDGTFDYTPPAGFSGTDVFYYTICDDDTPTASCDTATVTINVTDQGNPDAVNDGIISVTEDSTTPTSIDWDVNDSLIDNAVLNTFDATSVNGGTVTNLGGGNFGYVPAPGFAGTDTFTYKICDDDTPTATCDTATVTINVTDQGSPDAVNDGIISVTEDSTTPTSIDWDANDSLIDNAVLNTFDATSVNGGTVTNLGGGNFGYVPAPGFAGTDTFTYKICDDDTPTASCDSATVTINVTDQGSPDAVNDGIISVTEDITTPTSIDWDANDSLIDNAVLNTFDATSVNGGTVTNLGGGNFGYVPAPGFAGTDTFTYKICDDDTPTASCDTATVTINVTDQGNPDAVNDGIISVTEDSTTPTSIDWDNNDSLLDNATLNTFDATSVNGGTVTNLGGGNFGYVPAPGFVGTDTFTYKICDDDTPTPTCDTATVTINVTDQGTPDAIDNTATVTEDSTTPTSIDWDNNDSLLDNATLNTFDATSVNGGTVTNLGGGNFGYVPPAGFAGTDVFYYTICDDDTPVATCDTATVRVTVTDQGSPNAVDDGVVTVVEDTTTVTSIDWDNNDSLLDNATLASVSPTSVNGGIVTNLGGGNFGYVPAAGFVGTDTFVYTICDDDSPTPTCDTATVTINVTDQGSPVAVDDVLGVVEDTTTPTNVVWQTGDTLIDNSKLTSIDTTGTLGTVIFDNTLQTITYVPTPGYVGTDTFTYTICDDDKPTATCDIATVTINVTDQGSPDAVDNTATVTEDSTTPTSIDWDNNDSLLDNATLNMFDATSVNGGTVTNLGGGNFGYVPASGFVGTDTFTYTVCDDDTPTATCDTATVTINVTDQGTPDAVNDTKVLTENFPTTRIDWDNNDVLTDNATLKTFDSTSVNGGTIINNGDGSFDYKPAPGYFGSDTFTYTICDDDLPTATCDTATVTITVQEDHDNDGIPDVDDLDDDNDGILDTVEGTVDTDGDGIPNNKDLDSDNDGILDLIEAGGTDNNKDGMVDGFKDLNGDGYHDPLVSSPLTPPDSDGDGKPDYLDIDSDNDGAVDTVEGQTSQGFIAPKGVDTDKDGIDDAYDVDNGGTPIVRIDTDGDGKPDVIDTDADNDGILDIVEANDANFDGKQDYVYTGVDTDNDGLDDV